MWFYLDEPMAGMSVENIPALVEIIRSLATVHKKTVLIVEHHMEVIWG
jgi:branched-chain amino acid transport system ATP-binding protein